MLRVHRVVHLVSRDRAFAYDHSSDLFSLSQIVQCPALVVASECDACIDPVKGEFYSILLF